VRQVEQVLHGVRDALNADLSSAGLSPAALTRARSGLIAICSPLDQTYARPPQAISMPPASRDCSGSSS